jgi:(S)-ureidoglycine aminohydrolase
VFRKIHEPQPGFGPPPLTFGNAKDVQGEPFLGNEKAVLKVLLPTDPRFDMAVNIFTYQPGATLPFVETHIMEHGLLMLSGQGVYRLENAYYPVTAGDVIWMAPYCPQWFVAMGDEPASYLYYKDINRFP